MGIKVVASNKKAFHNYQISDRWEAGLALQGTEVKSLRAGKANLTDGWVNLENGEAFMVDVHISHYSHGNVMNHEEKRTRKLLFSKKEIGRLQSLVAEKGFALIPLKIYFKDRWLKVEIGLGKGKKLHDKRESKKQKDANRDIQRAIKQRHQ